MEVHVPAPALFYFPVELGSDLLTQGREETQCQRVCVWLCVRAHARKSMYTNTQTHTYTGDFKGKYKKDQ